jgi:hypothetical protein
MATVRFSKELVDQIVSNARAKMYPAVARADAQKPDNAWGQRIYDTLFADIKPLIANLPKGWVKTVENIEISEVCGRTFGMRFTLASPQPWPHHFYDTELAYKQRQFTDGIVLKNHPIWNEFSDEVAAYHQRRDDAKTRQEEFVGAVKKVCSTYTTLAPALKAWPPLWELIPEHVKCKHREVRGREKKEVVLDVDLGRLTAMSAAAKFGI